MTIPLYLDENVIPLLARLLRARGHDILTASEAGMADQEIPDNEQLAFATSVGRAIFTHDIKDYSPLAQVWATAGTQHAGIILGRARPGC